MPEFRGRTFAAFLFDMDGTMLDSSAVVERLWREWGKAQGVDAEALLATVHGARAHDIMSRFGRPDLDLAAEVARFNEAEINDVAGIVPIAGIHSVVENIDLNSWAVVTSAPRALACARLQAVDLPIPTTLIAAEDVEHGKPDPGGFLKAAALLGVPIGECLVFEDSPAGVEAARAAGASVAILGDLVAAGEGDLALTDYL